MRLIDAEQLRREIDKHYPFDELTQRKHDAFNVAKGEFLLLLAQQPVIDIIHCKDCKWKEKHNCTRAVEVFIGDEDYCSWAKRREDAAD